MKTKQQKIDFQKNKLVKFDEITNETASAMGRICVVTKANYENERQDERRVLFEKIDKIIENIK